jgi:hypothetical protein
MRKNNTPTLDNPTFDSVLSSGKKTHGVYVTLKSGEYVRCECSKAAKKALIDFDLYTKTCNRDLTQEAQHRLYAEHKAYIHDRFAEAGYTGTIHCTFADNVIHFEVLPQDAEEWFQKILATLNDDANLIDVSLKTAAA